MKYTIKQFKREKKLNTHLPLLLYKNETNLELL